MSDEFPYLHESLEPDIYDLSIMPTEVDSSNENQEPNIYGLSVLPYEAEMPREFWIRGTLPIPYVYKDPILTIVTKNSAGQRLLPSEHYASSLYTFFRREAWKAVEFLCKPPILSKTPFGDVFSEVFALKEVQWIRWAVPDAPTEARLLAAHFGDTRVKRMLVSDNSSLVREEVARTCPKTEQHIFEILSTDPIWSIREIIAIRLSELRVDKQSDIFQRLINDPMPLVASACYYQ